jgi:hypothetical protein
VSDSQVNKLAGSGTLAGARSAVKGSSVTVVSTVAVSIGRLVKICTVIAPTDAKSACVAKVLPLLKSVKRKSSLAEFVGTPNESVKILFPLGPV